MESLVEGVTFLRDFESFRTLLPENDVVSAALAEVPARPTEIVLDDVGYSYPTSDHSVLHGVSMRLQPGQVVAVVGPNGAGKSTLAKLLCGLLPPTSGTIRWDGIDIATCNRADVRARVAPVFQDFTRFEHTAREAIGFGAIDQIDDDAAIHEAARRAGADDFITPMANGYDTRLSTSFAGGTELSVGQWQRRATTRR